MIPTILLASFATALVAIIIQKCIYNPILNMGGGFSIRGLTFVVAGFGMSAILQNAYWLIWGAVSKSYDANFGDPVQLGSVSVQPVYLVVIVVALIVMALLHLMFKKTKIGLAMKAVSYNKPISALMGVNTRFIVSFAFGLAAFLSSVSGILSAQIIFVRYNMSATMLLKAFSAAVIGGLGNVYGAMLGGLIVGVVETFGSHFIGSAYKDVISFVIMILMLMLRPGGLFSTKTKQKA